MIFLHLLSFRRISRNTLTGTASCVRALQPILTDCREIWYVPLFWHLKRADVSWIDGKPVELLLIIMIAIPRPSCFRYQLWHSNGSAWAVLSMYSFIKTHPAVLSFKSFIKTRPAVLSLKSFIKIRSAVLSLKSSIKTRQAVLSLKRFIKIRSAVLSL